ncbi:MAG: hypothetical protein LBL62_07175 [Planctomycetaceae bacterium]|jgi:hypothetical protein|nr:hypothetical protein [Planctomycetaceae bacterium]
MSKFWDDIFEKLEKKLRDFVESFKRSDFFLQINSENCVESFVAERMRDQLDEFSWRIRYKNNEYEICTNAGSHLTSVSENDFMLIVAIIGMRIGTPHLLASHHVFITNVLQQCKFSGVIL